MRFLLFLIQNLSNLRHEGTENTILLFQFLDSFLQHIDFLLFVLNTQLFDFLQSGLSLFMVLLFNEFFDLIDSLLIFFFQFLFAYSVTLCASVTLC